MAAPTGPVGPQRSNGVIPAEWPAKAADTIVDTIDMVRDKTTKPALTAARGLVYGTVALIVGTVATVLVLVGIFRFLANYLPGDIWIVYAVFAAVFVLGGLICLKKANAPAQRTD